LRCRRTDSELSGGDGHCGAAKEAASILVDFVQAPVRIHLLPSVMMVEQPVNRT
jgi:hypothetical protein